MDFFSYIKDELNIILNDQQKEAVQADERRILLEACPGSGKTTTLVVRIAYLILCKKVAPADILTLTFSRASAYDMEERFNRLFGCFLTEPIHFSTIHSFCYRFLFYCQKKSLLIVPSLLEQINGRKLKVLRDIYLDMENEYLSDDEATGLSNEISFAKNKLISPSQIKSDFENFPQIYQKYESYKKAYNLIDFDDMLLMAYEILCSNKKLYEDYGRYSYVHVDEVQDTSLVQHRIIEELSRNGNLFMVGDTDQSIYGFRGAEPDYIVNIEKQYNDSRVLKLEINYRSTQKIVSLSNRFIQQNQNRHEKSMHTENAEGTEPTVYLAKSREEQVQKAISLVGDGSDALKTAVLFRNNLSGLPIAYKLIEKDIPFYVRENYMSFFRHYVVADVFSFFQLSLDFSDMESFIRVYYKMGAPISKADMVYLKDHLEVKKDIFNELFRRYKSKRYMLEHIGRIRKALKRISHTDPLNALRIIENDLHYNFYLKRNSGALNVFSTLKYFAAGTKTVTDLKTRLRTLKNGIDQGYEKHREKAVSLLTLHGSKGLEFDKVILIDLIDGEFPCEESLEELITGSRNAYEEEVRLFYVGVTRSRNELYLLAPQKSDSKEITPSRFINQFAVFDSKNEFGEGQIVVHKKFGEGVIISCNDDLAEILFKKYGRRRLSITTCLKYGLLTAVS